MNAKPEMIISLQDHDAETAVRIKAGHDQIPALLREIAGRVIDWRMMNLTISADKQEQEKTCNKPSTPSPNGRVKNAGL